MSSKAQKRLASLAYQFFSQLLSMLNLYHDNLTRQLLRYSLHAQIEVIHFGPKVSIDTFKPSNPQLSVRSEQIENSISGITFSMIYQHWCLPFITASKFRKFWSQFGIQSNKFDLGVEEITVLLKRRWISPSHLLIAVPWYTRRIVMIFSFRKRVWISVI